MNAMSALKRAGKGGLTPMARALAAKLLSGAASAAPPALLLALSLFATSAFAINGTKTIPGDYATLADAITDLNAAGVDGSGVTLNLLAGNAQTAPLGGYAITTLTGSAATPIVIQGNGNTITAPNGQLVGALNDAIFKVIGTDYVTLTGFVMTENAANTLTTAASNNMTEWGVALLYASTTDGAQNVTIQGNTIDLDRTYQNTFGIYSNSTHSATAVTTSATATGAAGGNSNLKIYANTITDVNIGMVVVGPTAAADQNDGLDIGGSTALTGNTITNFGTTGSFSSYANVSGTVNGILVRNNKNYNVSRNTITSSNGGMTVSGTMNGIQVVASNAAPTGTLTQTVNDNTISLRPGVAGATISAINLPGTTSVNATTSHSINNNNFNTFGHTVAGTGAINFVIQGGNPLTQNINGNTFTNISVNTTGAVTFFNFGQSVISGGSLSISNNQVVTGFTRTGVGATTVWSSNGSSVNGSTHAINNNNFSNITLTGASAFSGILDTDGASATNGPLKSVNGNTIANITTGAGTVVPMSVNFSGAGTTVSNNVITGISTGNSITALLLGTSNQATVTAAGNTIGGITSGGTAVVGISTASLTAALSKNKIYDLSGTVAGSVVSGITVANTTAGATVTVSNNLVGNLTAPISTSSNGVIGINIPGSSATSNFNVFYNTISLSGATSGAGFGSSGISAFASSTATTSALNLRNNIVVNTSVQNGAGLTVAYRRSLGTAGALANFASTSNNNDFYAGTPGASNLIYFDGTSPAQTIAAYKAGAFTAGTIAPRDSASISENPNFVSTVGSNANFLHISTATATQIESGAAPIAAVTDDFDGNARNATTPDIGADEFTGILLDLAPPVISYVPLGNTNLTGARTLTATITDATGVPTSGIGLPVLYWRVNAGSYAPVTATSLGSNQYSFTFGAGATTGDVVSYYIAAQDTASTPNVGTSPSTGASGFTANPPAASTPPTTPSSYNIAVSVTGSLNVGTAEAFTSLTRNDAQGIFKYLNDNVVTGNVVINLTSDLLIEDGAVALNEFAAPFTVTIKPSGGVRNVTGSTASAAMIRLNGASRVTIDGSISGGTDRSLVIENTSTTAPSVVRFASIGTAPITMITLKNAVIRNGATTSSAVVVQDAAAAAGYFNNITIQNNDIQKAFVGVFTNAALLAGNGNGLLITQNNLDAVGANAIRLVGVYVQGADGAIVSNNTIGNFNNADGENDTGIWLATGAVNTTVSGNSVSTLGYTGTAAFAPYGIRDSGGSAASGNNIAANNVTTITSNGTTQVYGIENSSGGTTIQRNNVQGIVSVSTGTYGAYGINSTGGNNVSIKNNFVSNISGDMTGGGAFSTQFGIFGIRVAAGNGVQVYNNSVNLYGARAGTANSALLTSAFALVSTASTGVDIRNNIFANNITGGTTSIANVSVYLPSGATSAMSLTWNNNAYYTGTDVARQGLGQVGTTAGTGFFLASDFNPVATTPAANFRSYTSTLSAAASNDDASLAFSTAVPFIGAADLHLQPLSAPESAGASIASVTNDFDNDPRPSTKPDIGADELVSNLTISPATVAFGNLAVGSTSTELTVTLANTGAGSLDVTTLDAAAAPFARTGTGTCAATLPITIAPGGSCTLTYTFAPTVAGAASQTLTVTSNGPGSGTIALTGTGTQGNLTITPTTVAFGNQLVGSTSSGVTVTLANTGNAALTVTALDAAAAPFASTGTCGTAPITIAAGASCTVVYTFSPTATGAASQTVTVTANAPGSGTIALSGTGIQGSLTITPASIAFGNVTVGANSGPTAVTLANTGDAPLTVTALSAATAPFSRVGGSCSTVPITIAAGSSCTVSYQFAPTATGPSSQTLTVTANAPGSGTIALSGTGVQGTLTISPTSLSFGNQAVGSTSTAQTVTLGNTGGAPLQVTALTPAAAPFALSGGSCGSVPITIAASASCTLTYTFAPTASGAANQTLTVTANAPGSGTIALSGTGTQGVLTITPTSVSFGTQTLNIPTAESTVTLANTGTASLDVTALTAAAAPFARTATGTCSPTLPIIIAAGNSCTLTYTFTPTATGPAGQTLTVTTDGTGSGTINLSGTGAGVGGVCPTGLPVEVSASAGTPGPTGYGTLKAGFDAINAGIHQGNIAVSICGDTTETATAALNASGTGSSIYTAVLVAPANGGARTISGNLAAPLVDLNGADNVTIDGLNAGGNALTFSNTSTASTAGTSTIRFIGGATNNFVGRTTLLGSSTTTLGTVGGGTVYFANDTVALTGNDNNTVSTNNIGPAGANLPNKAVFGLGTVTPISNANSGVVIADNNIFDFFNLASSVSGIFVADGNDAWTLSGNRLYQTAARTFNAGTFRYAGITLSQATAPRGSFTVISNVIGFAAANGTGTTTIGGTATEFRGIDAPNVDTTVATSIQGNTISGIVQTTNRATTTTTSSAFIGMLLGSSNGLFDVGGVTGNTIGSLDGSSTIVINGLATAATAPVVGIYDFSFVNGTISNNSIGAITIQGAGTTLGFRGILVSGTNPQTTTITNNTIGGPGAAGAIVDTQSGANASYGIQSTAATVVLTGNTVRNLVSNANGASVNAGGMLITATGSVGSTVARNTVHSLSDISAGTLAGAVYAIDLAFAAAPNVVERNLVHSLSVTSTAGYQLIGLILRGGTTAPVSTATATVRNNMIRLGLDAAGNAITSPFLFIGIRDSAGTAVANQYFHNSVYVGGTGVVGGTTGTVGSYAFNSDVVTGTRNFQNNIFWNARSNTTAGAFHIAARYGGTTANPAGLTSSHNDLYVTGTDGFTGLFNGFVYPDLASFQVATGQDANSFSGNPQFIAPNGTALTGDLHINSTIATPIEGKGLAIASVINDFDGEVRAGLTPTDVGADAGNFIPQVGNLTISPTAVPFGNVVVGATSTEQTVTLGNSGNGPLQVTALSAASAPFARTVTGTCSATLPITIAAGGSCTLTYTFSPTATGPASQTLTVTANAPGSGTIALSGTGVQGNLTITPTSVAFGNQTVGSTSTAQTVTLANTGSASLQVSALTPATAPFALSGGTCGSVPITIAAGGSCTLTYTFAPTATGAASQTLTVTADAPGSGTITLTGNGTQGALVINPTAIAFGNQSVGTTSTAQTVTLSNTGDASLNVTALTPASSPFARTGGSCGTAPFAIAAGSSCTLTYTFAPNAAGAASQTLTVTSDAPGSGTITLSGTGVQGNLVISPTTVNFGSPDILTTTPFKSVTLSNTGAGSLQVTSITLAAAPFVRTADGTCGNSLPLTIAAGASCTITYTFAPTTAGQQSQTFNVTTTSPGSGSFVLTGTGVSDRIFMNGFDSTP